MDEMHDRELDELFDDPELLRTAYFLKSARAPEPPLDPAFRMALRRELIRRAAEMNVKRQPWWRVFTMPPALAWSGAAVAAVVIAAVAALYYAGPLGGGGVAVSSPLNHVSNVAVVQPIPVTFSQPMDHASVEQAVTIEPATRVTYHWEGNTLYVQPVSGNLAPSTQYVVHVAPSAKSVTQQSVGGPKTITFVTQTPPARPQPTPSPVPTPTPAVNASALQPLGGAWSWSGWSPDGGTIYLLVGGQLGAVRTAGGSVKTLVAQGVKMAALSPDGSKLAYASDGKIQTIATDGTGTPTTVATADPMALAWFGTDVAYLADGKIVAGTSSFPLAAKPQVAVFSPDGGRLLYLDSTGTRSHLVDVSTGADTDLKTALKPLAWSPDGKQLAWLTSDSAIVAGDPASATGTKLTTLQAVGGIGYVSWSAGGQLLISNTASLWTVAADGTGLHKVADGDFTDATWAPDASHLAFARGSALWYGQVTGTKPLAPPTAFDAASRLVGDFMAARVRGDSDAASAFLDADAKQAYAGGLSLIVRGDPHLSRFYTVYSEQVGASSFRFVVRLVLSRAGIDTSQQEETLVVQPDASGRMLIHAASGGAAQTLGKGPNVIQVQVLDATHLKISFDSDLDPSAAQQVVVRAQDGSAVSAQGAYADRVVTLTLAHPLTSGTSYRLVVPTSVKDVAGRTSPAEYDLDFSGPATAAS